VLPPVTARWRVKIGDLGRNKSRLGVGAGGWETVDVNRGGIALHETTGRHDHVGSEIGLQGKLEVERYALATQKVGTCGWRRRQKRSEGVWGQSQCPQAVDQTQV